MLFGELWVGWCFWRVHMAPFHHALTWTLGLFLASVRMTFNAVCVILGLTLDYITNFFGY